jgi:hypothetical protein
MNGEAPTTLVQIAYWAIVALLVPTIGALVAWVKQKDKDLEKARGERVTDMREQIAQYNDALQVVKASFELAKDQGVAMEHFRSKVLTFIDRSETNHQALKERLDRILSDKH